MDGKLYVVATPIGNLEDISPRAVRTLAEADLIAAEDTRHSRVLLARFSIKTPLVSCHKFNEAEKLDYFMEALRSGKNIALISDAGTPCLSDPGHRLVARAGEEGAEVIGVCGPNAAVTALSVSGFDASSFVFMGFLPRHKKDIAKVFEDHFRIGVPVVFYESPKRMAGTLEILAEDFPNTCICLCNDLSKKFERTYRGTPAQVLFAFRENPSAEKGEYVCVAKPDRAHLEAENATKADGSPTPASTEARLVDIMLKNGSSLKAAVNTLHEESRLPKKEIYAASLRLKAMFSDE